MKLLMAMLLALALAYQATGQTIKDSLGNQITPYQWVWFNTQQPFHHPNGHSYKNVWVYTKPRQYSNYKGWLTVAGLIWGIQDASAHHYMDNWGGSTSNIWRFSSRLATGYLLGYSLDWIKSKDWPKWESGGDIDDLIEWFKERKDKPKGYVYIVRNPRTQ